MKYIFLKYLNTGRKNIETLFYMLVKIQAENLAIQ